MVRVYPTEPHTRRSSYHFFPDVRLGSDPIFVRRTAAKPPPQLQPRSRKMRWARDRFALANQLWSNFDPSQRAFYRAIAIEVPSDPRGRQRQTKLLSGQELFVALMMILRALFEFLGLIPRRYDPFGGDVCGTIYQRLELEIYSKSLKRTIGRWTQDEGGYFQWISLPEWAAPFRVCAIHPDLGRACHQYETLEDLMILASIPVIHPISVHTPEVDRWTYPTDPIWCRISCVWGTHSLYNFETYRKEAPLRTLTWRRPEVRIFKCPDHIFAVSARTAWTWEHNYLYWHDKEIMDIYGWGYIVHGSPIYVYGPTGEIVEEP